MPFGSLKKLGISDGKEAIYRKGTEEGLLQGYLQAKKELQKEISQLKEEMQTKFKKRKINLALRYLKMKLTFLGGLSVS